MSFTDFIIIKIMSRRYLDATTTKFWVDIVICNSRERPSLLINETPNKNTWLSLKLKGKKDPYALGARASAAPASEEAIAFAAMSVTATRSSSATAERTSPAMAERAS